MKVCNRCNWYKPNPGELCENCLKQLVGVSEEHDALPGEAVFFDIEEPPPVPVFSTNITRREER